MLADLLESMYLAGARRRADESVAAVEEYLRNRESSEREDADFELEMAPGGALHARVVAFHERRKPQKPARRVRSIRGAPRAGVPKKGEA